MAKKIKDTIRSARHVIVTGESHVIGSEVIKVIEQGPRIVTLGLRDAIPEKSRKIAPVLDLTPRNGN